MINHNDKYQLLVRSFKVKFVNKRNHNTNLLLYINENNTHDFLIYVFFILFLIHVNFPFNKNYT